MSAEYYINLEHMLHSDGDVNHYMNTDDDLGQKNQVWVILATKHFQMPFWLFQFPFAVSGHCLSDSGVKENAQTNPPVLNFKFQVSSFICHIHDYIEIV